MSPQNPYVEILQRDDIRRYDLWEINDRDGAIMNGIILPTNAILQAVFVMWWLL